MAQSGMDAHCPMTPERMVSGDCQQGCCPLAILQAFAPVAATKGPRLTVVRTQRAELAAMASMPQPVICIHSSLTGPIDSPPRYILNRTLRI